MGQILMSFINFFCLFGEFVLIIKKKSYVILKVQNRSLSKLHFYISDLYLDRYILFKNSFQEVF